MPQPHPSRSPFSEETSSLLKHAAAVMAEAGSAGATLLGTLSQLAAQRGDREEVVRRKSAPGVCGSDPGMCG
jgi:hypothetical protein